MTHVLVWVVLLLLPLWRVPATRAQQPQFLECPEVNLLGSACEGAVQEDDRGPRPAPPVPEAPLFTLQTMHPSTPPLMIKALNDPSDANLDAFLDWEHRYLARTLEVETRLKHRRQERKR